MTFAAWERATKCTEGPTPGAKALMAGCLEAFESKGAFNLGIYNCRDVRGAKTKSTHGEGRACDVGFPMKDNRATADGHALVTKLRAEAAGLGLQTIIYDRTIWSAKSPGGRRYTGEAPHYDHLHIELTRAASRDLTLATVRAALGTGAGSVIPKQKKSSFPVLRKGSKGSFVVLLQKKVGVKADGIFGPRTEEAVKRFQADQGDLVVDGIVGAATWSRVMAGVLAPDKR